MAAAQSRCHARVASTDPTALIWQPRSMSASISRSAVSRWWRRLSSMFGGLFEQIGDLIDVRAHRFRRSLGIAAPERFDNRLVSEQRSPGPPLLLQRQLARLDEHIVERRHDVDDDAFTGR